MTGKMHLLFSKMLVLAAIVGTACGCSRHVDHSADARELMQTSRDWSHATSGGNLNAILSFWADDATVIIPGLPSFHGKKAIRDYVMQSLKTPGFHISWEPEEAHVSESGDIGYLLEHSDMTMPDAKGRLQTQRFRVVTIWRKGTDGKWRNVVDSSVPE
jgi:uncharacterized protein (TIGR02246 family)